MLTRRGRGAGALRVPRGTTGAPPLTLVDGRRPRVAHSEEITAHQLGYLTRGRGARRRRGPARVPLLRMVVEPGRSIDFAHPELGFPGHHHLPPAERVLRLWRDDLVTVEHADHWRFVVRSPVPFDRRWISLLERSLRDRRRPALAAVFASFAGQAPPGPFHLAEVDATTYTTLVRVEDRRAPS
ncbi:hypothetical protein HIDPHFAB_00930 [Nocardioides sp. T2.26MG-1]|nr:hypothetical protein HIDPHFAB_00930 [Nocardioides sp. T2.26MG-1]